MYLVNKDYKTVLKSQIECQLLQMDPGDALRHARRVALQR